MRTPPPTLPPCHPTCIYIYSTFLKLNFLFLFFGLSLTLFLAQKDKISTSINWHPFLLSQKFQDTLFSPSPTRSFLVLALKKSWFEFRFGFCLETVAVENMKNPQSSLPPGFRFHPTDEELILHYLRKKVASTPFPASIIADVDIYKFDPWDLPAMAAFGEREWYFFSPRDRKYPNGVRPNRAAASGYWKATGTDKIIMTSTMVAGAGGGVMQENIGVKKALVFYKGRPPKGVKTNWIMHEYRLADAPSNNHNNKPIMSKDSPMRLDHWVLCRIYKKANVSTSSIAAATSGQEQEEQQKFVQNPLLPALKSPVSHNRLNPQKSCSFSNLLDAMDYSFLNNILSDNQGHQTGFDFSTAAFNNNAGTQDQAFFSTGGNIGSSSGSFMIRQLPPLNNSCIPKHGEQAQETKFNY